MLKGKTIVLGVTGSIAAYKAANLASMLKKAGAMVHVIMTQNATNFINPITFETLTGNKCLVDTFDRNFEFSVEHVSLAKAADLIVTAPATANVMAKYAHGLADDMLTTTVLAATCPKLVVPAMNTRMYDNCITQENIEYLNSHGFTVMEPSSGYLACGDSGRGRFPDENLIMEEILYLCAMEHDLAGRKVLITAGPTREAIDPVRFITNHSTGKMGYAIARMAMLRGAEVTLISGPVDLDPVAKTEVVNITSATELYDAAAARSDWYDIAICAAAVADYSPERAETEKIHKGGASLTITLDRTPDTLRMLGERKREDQVLCGFAMETSDLEQRARDKLVAKNLDLICANNLKVPGAGFGVDTNVITLIDADTVTKLPCMSKLDAAGRILDDLIGQYTDKTR